eukprot:1152067-Ditylum_brightwellii.AAC.1
MILALDANKDLGDKQELSELVKSFSLIVAHEQFHQSSPPATYKRGTEQLDCIFVTPGLLPAIAGCGFLQYDTGIFSDHCTLWINFLPEMLFLGEINNPTNFTARKLYGAFRPQDN